MRTSRSSAAIVIACVVTACSSDGEVPPLQPAPDASGGASGTAGAGGGDTGGAAGVGSLSSGVGGGATGCDKVDFLFIIDNSVSMEDQQEALIDSFPGFIAAIQDTLTATSDYHIMVADTDDVTRCTPANCASGAMNADDLCDAPNGYACTASFEACDNVIGAGVLHPAGDLASNMPCPVFGGNRYMIDGEPDLAGTFACVARVGTAGHPEERPMDSLVAAMSDELNGVDGCNEGFLRNDAILVVTFISDDPNYEDADGPDEWYDAVLAAKNGDEQAIVVLGLTPNFDGCQDGNGPPKGSHWSEFVAKWGDHGLEADVCGTDYVPFFEQAIAIIDETCDEFDPPR